MKKDIEILINDLCVEWGFCIPTTDKEKILSLDCLNADQFACLILEAEEMNPEYEIKWRRKIRTSFSEKFGNEIEINKSTYK